MTVVELVDMLSKLNANPDYICAWNAKGNTPPMGWAFKRYDELVYAYGNDTVIEWTLKGGFSYIELTVKLAIRETKEWEN